MQTSSLVFLFIYLFIEGDNTGCCFFCSCDGSWTPLSLWWTLSASGIYSRVHRTSLATITSSMTNRNGSLNLKQYQLLVHLSAFNIIRDQNTNPAFRLDVKTEKKEKENVYLLTQGLHVKNYQASKLIRHVNVFHYQHRKTQEEYTTLAGFKHFEMYCPSCMDIFFLHQVYKYSFPFICVSICSMKTFLEERKIKSYV